MNDSLVQLIAPELTLAIAACVLMLLGVSGSTLARKAAPVIAIGALLTIFVMQLNRDSTSRTAFDAANTIRINGFANYIRLIGSGMGALLVLLAWPTNRDGTGNNALNFGQESGEFFGLMLLSICGLFLVATANDIILLFLGLELASLPTYVMVSISRPLPVAQEAGVKYFFLGALSAALMLFGFSYLYGTTGTTDLQKIAAMLQSTITNGADSTNLTHWQLLAAVFLIGGFAFKLAAVPLHFYAADVYQGAATPVTAFLAFVPKTSGVVALIKILYAIGGGSNGTLMFAAPHVLFKLLWALAVLTMFAGNVLGLLQTNIKRVLAYSSVAHSGYLLVGVTTLIAARSNGKLADDALSGILFYLAAYGLMNTGAFAVLTLLPARDARLASSAETFDDLAGQGRAHPVLGLAMAISCFSLIGLPLTIGFFGKFLLIKPALGASLYGLVILMIINAAISAAYYLRIVATMFLRTEPAAEAVGTFSGGFETRSPEPFTPTPRAAMALPILLCVLLSATGTLLFGMIFPATTVMYNQASDTSNIIDETIVPSLPAVAAPQPADAHAGVSQR